MSNEPYDTATHGELKLMQGFPPPLEKQVNAQNGLWEPPYNRWAYQNMRALLPTAKIAHAETPAHLPRKIDGGIEHLEIKREDGSTADFDTFLRQTFTDSFVVVKNGNVVCERYLNGMTGQQPHQMMSCTKSFVGIFALMAVEDGLITETEIIGDHIREVNNGGAFSDATFGQVLNMTNSMDYSEDYADPKAHIRDYARIIGLGSGLGEDLPADNLYDYLATLVKEDGLPHGEVFHYQTPKTDMANWVTNRLTGKSLLQNLENLLWQRLGTDGETYVLLDGSGTPVAGGGLNATPNDLARFATMILNNGEFAGQQLVPEAVIEKISAGGSTDAFMKGPDAIGRIADGYWSYRAKWWVRRTPGREAMSAIGINGQWIYIDRDRDVAIIKQSSQPVAVSTYFDDYTLNAFDTIIDHLS